MSKNLIRRALVAVAITSGVAGAAVLPAATMAHAQSKTVTYTLTPKEKGYACGNFGGTIIFGDGSSLDCHTGVATIPAAS